MLAPVDVESAVCTLLGARTSVPQVAGKPDGIRVLRVGGQQTSVVQSQVRLTVECWAADEVAAFDLARLSWARLWGSEGAFMGAVWVSRVELTDPVNLPDTEASRPRYQFIAQLTVALDEITPQEIA